MTDLQQRLAEFEATMRDRLGWTNEHLKRGPDGEYVYPLAQGAWTGWTQRSNKCSSPEPLREALQELVDLRGHGSWGGKWIAAWDKAYAALRPYQGGESNGN